MLVILVFASRPSRRRFLLGSGQKLSQAGEGEKPVQPLPGGWQRAPRPESQRSPDQLKALRMSTTGQKLSISGAGGLLPPREADSSNLPGGCLLFSGATEVSRDVAFSSSFVNSRRGY